MKTGKDMLREFMKDLLGISDVTTFENVVAKWDKTPGLYNTVNNSGKAFKVFGFVIRNTTDSAGVGVLEIVTPDNSTAIWIYKNNKVK